MLHGGSGGWFIGYFISDVHQKTLSKTLQVRFYVFEGTTCHKLLLSYAASERPRNNRIQSAQQILNIFTFGFHIHNKEHHL